MATKPNIPDFPDLPDVDNMIAQACELIANIRGIPYDFNGTLSLENKFTVLFKTVQEMFKAQDELVESYKELYDFINTYFSKLDVQEEVNKKIQSMADDGSLLTIIAPTVATRTSEWLQSNITNPSNPPIDKSLTVENAAADAKVTGNFIHELQENTMNTIGNYFLKKYSTFSAEWKQGSFNGAENKLNDNENARYAKFDVTSGDKFIIYGRLNQYLDLYDFVGNGEVIKYYRPTINTDENSLVATLIIPDNVDTLYINLPFDDITGNIYAYYITKTITVGTNKYQNDFTSLLDAILSTGNRFNNTIHIYDGTYDLIKEYKNVYGESFFDNFNDATTNRGIELQNNIQLIFETNTLVTCNYEGTNKNVQELFSAFYPKDYGCTIDNITLKTQNIRYSIHDERNGAEMPNTNKYLNCKITHDSTNTQWGAHQCIGGGFGMNSTVIIENCVFNSIGFDYAVSYHNNNDWNARDYESKVIINNCFFVNGGFYIGSFGYGEKISTAYVSNSSFAKDAKIDHIHNSINNSIDNVDLYKWGNEFRSN